MEVTNIYSNLIHGCNDFFKQFSGKYFMFHIYNEGYTVQTGTGSENKIPKIKGSEGTKAEYIHDLLLFYCSSNFQYFLFIVKNKEYN